MHGDRFIKLKLFFASNKLVWIIIIGIILRGVRYITNPALWADESLLALNIINKSFKELLHPPLDYNQAAPVGFLIIEKLMVQIFGNSEYTLRFIPFLAGILSLFLFYKFIKFCIKPTAVPIALFLFAITTSLLFYSSTVKQYSIDVCIGLLLYLMVIRTEMKNFSISSNVWLGIIGAISIWFSHPSVFILAGVGITLTSLYILKREWQKIGRLSIAELLWILSFIVSYFSSLRDINPALLEWWRKAFLPLPPSSFSEFREWFIFGPFKILENPAGFRLPGLAALAVIIGGFSIYSNKKIFFFLISPIIFALVASAIHRYPFTKKFLLFIVPALLILTAQGAERIVSKTLRISPIIAVSFIVLLFFHPLLAAIYRGFKPLVMEEMRPVIKYMLQHRQESDILYVHHLAEPSFKYYSIKQGFDVDYIAGSGEDLHCFMKDLEKVCGKSRVWVLFSYIYLEGEATTFLRYLNTIGTRIDFLEIPTERWISAVYLYDLTQSE